MDDFTAAVRPDHAFVALLGPDAARTLAASVSAVAGPDGAATLAALADAPLWSHVSAGSFFVARARQLGADGFWVGGTPDELARLREALAAANVCRLAPDVAEAARIRAGEPAPGREITEDVFPMEVGLDGAIDYRKGCFLGQEPIVRIRDRGHVNWRMVRLELAPAAQDPVPGDRLESDARPKAGRITSVARLPDGRALALALVHVSVPADATLRALAAGGPVTATVLE
jgi:folate-binding protein YgfZ